MKERVTKASRQTKPKSAKSMEAALGESCNKLRGAVELKSLGYGLE